MGDEELAILGIFALVTFILPLLLCFLAGRFTDRIGKPGGVILGAAPAVLVVGGFALSLALSIDPTCEPPECGMGGVWVIPLFLFAAVMGAVGGAFGFASFLFGRRLRHKRREWDL